MEVTINREINILIILLENDNIFCPVLPVIDNLINKKIIFAFTGGELKVLNLKNIFLLKKEEDIIYYIVDLKEVKKELLNFSDLLVYFKFSRNSLTRLIDHKMNIDFNKIFLKSPLIELVDYDIDIPIFNLPDEYSMSLDLQFYFNVPFVFIKKINLTYKRYLIHAKNKLAERFSINLIKILLKLYKNKIDIYFSSDWRHIFEVESIYNKKYNKYESKERIKELCESNFAPRPYFWAIGVDNDLWW